ncbi:glutathione peroxidase 2-like [Watersipora subatra]|uniref:glutathione peroxidase 2-like n=1 Tax=Watersipora subatra TaxID=2589382 RepID=UPI00355AD440
MAANIVVRTPVTVTKFHDFTVEDIKGNIIKLEKYAGKVLVIINVASLGNDASKVFQQMNDFQDKFGKRIAVLGFPCNQFHHSEKCDGEELQMVLRHVRPGNEFCPVFELFKRVEVNGANAHPVFQYLRESLPLPGDNIHSFVDSSADISWVPVCRNDIADNFEKFIVAPNGKPYRRYSSKIQVVNLYNDVQVLLDKFKDHPSMSA